MPAEPLAEATVRVRPDTRGFREDLHQQVSDDVGKEGDTQGKTFGGRFADQAKKALSEALKDLPDVKLDADSTPADIKLAGIREELERLSHEKLGVTIDDRQLLEQIARIKLELAALGAGSGSLRLKVDTDAAVKDLEGAAKGVTGTAAKLGQSAGQSFSAAFADAGPLEAIGGLLANPLTGVPLLAGAALIGAEVGGVLGGAIVAGVADAGVGAGIVAAFRDPQVKAAAQGILHDLGPIADDLRDEFATPTIAGLQLIDLEVRKLRPGIKAAMAELAPLSTDLLGGAAAGLDRLVPHLERALVDAKPLIEWTAGKIPEVLDEVGGLLENLAEHADEERFALNAFFGGVKIGIKVLEGLADAGELVLKPIEKVHDLLVGAPQGPGHMAAAGEAAAAAIDSMHHASEQAAPSLEDLQKQLRGTALTADMLAGEMADKVFDGLMSADRAALGLAESQAHLSDSLRQNGRDFRLTTDAGRANREAVLQSLDANRRMYDIMIQGGVSAQDAAKAYDQNTDALERQLHKAHVAQGTIDQLIGKYRQVPDKVDTNISMNGLADAINDLDDLLRQLNNLPSRKTVVIEERHHVTGQNTPQRWGGVHYAADGLVGLSRADIYTGGPIYGFAEPETGGEAFVPRNGNPARSSAILQEAAGWYGMTVAPAGGDRQMLAALGALVAEQQRTNELLSSFGFSVSAGQLALLARSGSRTLAWQE